MTEDEKLTIQVRLAEALILTVSHVAEERLNLDMGNIEHRNLIHEVLVELAATMPTDFIPRAELEGSIEAEKEPLN